VILENAETVSTADSLFVYGVSVFAWLKAKQGCKDWSRSSCFEGLIGIETLSILLLLFLPIFLSDRPRVSQIT
jgi:hypothetical protein